MIIFLPRKVPIELYNVIPPDGGAAIIYQCGQPKKQGPRNFQKILNPFARHEARLDY